MIKFKKHNATSVRDLRRKLNLTQKPFWNRIGVTQSGGSRYETGRKIPDNIQMLLYIAYGDETAVASFITKLRDISTQ